MRRYSAEEEERVRTLRLVDGWLRSRLLDAAQAEALRAALPVDLRRTNVFLRAGLALFAALIVAAFVGLVIVSLGLRSETSIAVITALGAIACFVAADFLVATWRCYRFGVEETLAVAAVLLLAISGAEYIGGLHLERRWLAGVAALLIGSAGAYGLYRRFGLVYAAIGSVISAAAIPFQLPLSSPIQRALAALAFGAAFAIARLKRRQYGEDYPGDEFGIVQAAACAGMYLVLNLQLTGNDLFRVDGWFYWFTYAATWILPAIGVRLGVRERDRELMDVAIALALVTLATSKPYLGWERHTWDPIVLGVALIGLATAVRRWIETGPGARLGFTLDPDREALSMLNLASSLVPPGIAPRPTSTAGEPPAFGGGRSGGGGGGDRF